MDEQKDEQKEEQKPERRRAVRIKKQLMAQYKDEASFYKWNMGAVSDFSELGMLIATEESFAPNAILNFKFKLPSNPFECLELRGRIVACEKKIKDGKQAGASGYSTKIEFLDMKPQQQESIRAYINWFLNQGGGYQK